MKPLKVIITGDRNWTDRKTIRDVLCKLPEGSVVIHGDCPSGADRLADGIARELGLDVRPYPADWGRYRKGAGPIRNQQMLNENPDVDAVFAFHDDLWARSRGTKDMVERTITAGKRWYNFVQCESDDDAD